MHMGSRVIWWIGIWMDVILLLRGMRTGLDRRYPFFYTYVACVLIKEIIGLLSYQPAPTFYEKSYWPAELATVVASYAELFGFSSKILDTNPAVPAFLTKNYLWGSFFWLTLQLPAFRMVALVPSSPL